MGYMMGNFGGMDLFGFGWIFMILVWVLIIVGVIALVKWLVHEERWDKEPKKMERSPLDILKERYAKGEIGKDEYEQRKKDLMS